MSKTLPAFPATASGSARIVSEIPTRIVVQAQMDTPGLLVLTDFWEKGWRAYVGGRAAPILRTDYALRGVRLPAGPAVVEFRYEPALTTLTFWLAGAALLVICGWVGLGFWRKRTTAAPGPGASTLFLAEPVGCLEFRVYAARCGFTPEPPEGGTTNKDGVKTHKAANELWTSSQYER